MKHAELCPVCKGSGKILQPIDSQCTGVPFSEVCHGCDGKGWVTIKDESEEDVWGLKHFQD